MSSVHSKVKCIFPRKSDGHLETDRLNPEIDGMLDGSVATVKHHGQCSFLGTMDHSGCLLWRRYDRKPDKKRARGVAATDLKEHHLKMAPKGWISMMANWDPNTGHWPGWKPLRPDDPEEKWYFDLKIGAIRINDVLDQIEVRILSPDVKSAIGYKLDWVDLRQLAPHSYEFIGPKVQGNRYGLEVHCFVRHGSFLADLNGVEISYDGLRAYLNNKAWEGIVWHGPKGLVKVHCGHLNLNDHWESVPAQLN